MLKIQPKLEDFENDFLSIELPNGGYIVFNIIDEDITYFGGSSAEINAINIQLILVKDKLTLYTDCTNVIGMSDALITIKTAYSEYIGKVLSKDNIKYCEVLVNVEE